MPQQVEIFTEGGDPYQAQVRPGTQADRQMLVKLWAPLLDRERAMWPDWEWPWQTLGKSDLHLDDNPELLVLADELEPGSSGELFGVMVTTGPTTAQQAGLGLLLAATVRLLWLEYISTAPSIRRECPSNDQRQPRVKGVGRALMCAAIGRSFDLRLDGAIGLHAEGRSADTYGARGWGMRNIGDADHRAGGSFPVFFGDASWAADFSGRTA